MYMKRKEIEQRQKEINETLNLLFAQEIELANEIEKLEQEKKMLIEMNYLHTLEDKK